MPSLPDFHTTVSGTLTSQHGFPLQEFNIQMFYIPSGVATDETNATTLSAASCIGEAVTDVKGHFLIDSRAFEFSEERIHLLQHFSQTRFILKVADPKEKVIHVTEPYNWNNSSDIQLTIQIPTHILAIQTWKIIASRMENAGLESVRDLVQALVLVPRGASIFSDWSYDQRFSAAAAIEEAILDPDGVLAKHVDLPPSQSLRNMLTFVAFEQQLSDQFTDQNVVEAFVGLHAQMESFHTLADVDWQIDMKMLKEGNVKAAVNASRLKFEDAVVGFSVGKNLSYVDKNLLSYRNYLRAIFTGGVSVSGTSEEGEKLKRRFHQDFWSIDTSLRPANKVMASIFRDILIAPTGEDYGFGKAASSIEQQGDRTPRQYLDYLIGLTKTSASQLELRYRINLHREDSILSNPVQENIYTLQAFYRDGFQSKEDPFPIIPDEILGIVPFFLEFDEWMERQEPFYGENYHQPFETFYLANKSGKKNFDEVEEPHISSLVGDLMVIQDLICQARKNFSLREYTIARQGFEEASKMVKNALFNEDYWPEDIQKCTILELLDKIDPKLEYLKSLPMNDMADLYDFIKDHQLNRTPWDYPDPL